MLTRILIPVLFLFAISVIVRILLRAIWNPYRIHRPYFGPYGYHGYGRSYRRHHFPGTGLLTILCLVAAERLFSRRY